MDYFLFINRAPSDRTAHTLRDTHPPSAPWMRTGTGATRAGVSAALLFQGRYTTQGKFCSRTHEPAPRARSRVALGSKLPRAYRKRTALGQARELKSPAPRLATEPRAPRRLACGGAAVTHALRMRLIRATAGTAYRLPHSNVPMFGFATVIFG